MKLIAKRSRLQRIHSAAKAVGGGEFLVTIARLRTCRQAGRFLLLEGSPEEVSSLVRVHDAQSALNITRGTTCYYAARLTFPTPARSPVPRQFAMNPA